MARPTPLPWRVARTLRVAAHVAEGLATAVLIFPLVESHRRNALTKQLVAPAAAHAEGRRAAARRIARRRRRQPPDRRQSHLVARHLRADCRCSRRASSPRPSCSDGRSSGGSSRGVGTLYVERARRRDTHNVNRQAAEALARGDVLAIFPEGTTTDGTTLLPFHGSLLQPIVDAEGHVLPVAIRYRTPEGLHTAAAAYVGDTSILESFWRVDRRIGAGRRDASSRHRCRRGFATGASSSRAAEHVIRTVLASAATSPGTWYTRRSGSLIAVSAPPHRHPESSISRLGASLSSSVDQCPHTTVTPADAALRMREPWKVALRRAARPALLAELHRAVGGAEAQPRERVDDDAQPVESLEIVAPRARLVAVEARRETRRPARSQHRLHLAREHAARWPASIAAEGPHAPAVARPRSTTRRRAHSHSISSSRSGASRIGPIVSSPCARAMPGGDRQQVQVVIAEHRHRGVAERHDLAQHAERVGSAIDEVADEPQPVLARRKADQLQQRAELGVAALDVADRVEAHGCASRGGLARRTRRATRRPARIRDEF